MPNYPSKDAPRLMVRVPVDVKKWLMQQSRKNASSQSSEIVRALRERMDREVAHVR